MVWSVPHCPPAAAEAETETEAGTGTEAGAVFESGSGLRSPHSETSGMP